MNGDALITGATGLIGGEIAWRLMRSGRRVWCVVRSRSFPEAAARMERRFALSGQTCDWSKLVALPGDVTRDLLGLDPDALRHLRRECRHVIHCAADTSFATHNRCTEVNLTGTQNILKLCAALGPQVRLFHTSSALTCLKSATGVIHEDDSPAGYSNDYVLSKRNCERLVLQSPVNAVVLRPSIVLSHGVNPPEFARSVLWVLPVMRRLGVLPLSGNERLDMVSVRFVAEAVAQLLRGPLPDRVYHLSTGIEASITGRELFDALTLRGHDYSRVRFDSNLDWPRFDPPQPSMRRLKHCVDYYLPILCAGAAYDCNRLKAVLGHDFPNCPKASEYCADLLDQFTEREACEESLNP